MEEAEEEEAEAEAVEAEVEAEEAEVDSTQGETGGATAIGRATTNILSLSLSLSVL